MPITYRFYLADAVFLAGVEGERELIDGLQDALRRPRFPLYLGRRSCPPEGRILQDLHESDLEDTLGTGDHGRRVSWQAATWWRRRQGPHVGLEIVRDARPDEVGHDLVNDTPVSFDPAHRRYAARSVVHEWTDVDNPDSLGDRAGHEPMDMLGGF